jgi:hypothetical protein
VLGLILVGLALCILWLAFFGPPRFRGGTLRWALLAFMVYFAASYLIWLPLKWRRIYRQYKGLQRPQKYLITDEAMKVEAENGSGTIRWSELVKWKEGNGVFLLYPSDVLFYIVPLRFFASAEQIESFRQLLSRALRA